MSPEEDISGAEKQEPKELCKTLSLKQGVLLETGSKPRVYKRRWIGLALLFCLNLMASIAWTDVAVVPEYAASHFGTSVSAINWFPTSFLFAALAGSYPASVVARRSIKLCILAGSFIMFSGAWLMYGGTNLSSLALALVGHTAIGFALPSVLITLAPYSEMWFTPERQATATAFTTTANLLGGTIGQFIMTAWIPSEDAVGRGMLPSHSGLGCLRFSPLFPLRPPTAPDVIVVQHQPTDYREELMVLLRRPEFFLLAIPFSVTVGVFNALSFLLYQMCMPYGFSVDQCVVAGCLFVVPGLVVSLVLGRLADRFGCHLLFIKITNIIMGCGILAFVWVPHNGNFAYLYTTCTVLSLGVVSSGPLAIVFISEILYPVRPELAITVMWSFGQLLGAVLTIGLGYITDSHGGLQPAVYLQTAFSLACVPLVQSLGLWGRSQHVKLNRRVVYEN
ncbi:hypothetical protein AUP68_14275 [Ilyonectria robusta]